MRKRLQYYNLHIYNIYFTTKYSGFTKILKVRIRVFFKFVLGSRSENTGPVPRDHVTPSQIRNGTPLQL